MSRRPAGKAAVLSAKPPRKKISRKPRSPEESAAVPFYRPVWAEVDHARLRANFAELNRLLYPGTSILAVVKANAYGHGMVAVSRTLADCGARALGVTSLEEALELKRAGLRPPALILGNIFPFSNLVAAVRHGVHVTAASLESARMCDQYGRRAGRKVPVHAKIDTGMGRIGVNVKNGLEFVRRLSALPNLRLEGVYTHFSGSAEDPDFTRKQLRRFTDLVAALRGEGLCPPWVHCANSAALIKYPESRFTLVRPGISLYGISPVPRAPLRLSPILSWKSRIVFLKDVPAGTPISYAGTFVTRRPSKIATAAFGYADGFRRSLSNKGKVLVRGRRVPVVGRVTMDMTMLDVTDLSGAAVGDEVVILGRQGSENIPAQELAEDLQTSPYEVFCGIAPRVPRLDLHT